MLRTAGLCCRALVPRWALKFSPPNGLASPSSTRRSRRSRCRMETRAISNSAPREAQTGVDDPPGAESPPVKDKRVANRLLGLVDSMKDVLEGWGAADPAAGGHSGQFSMDRVVGVSGRYVFAEGEAEPSRLFLDPFYRIGSPIPAPEPIGADAVQGIVLHVDVDGIDPLNVVSGTVNIGGLGSHFIGRVVSDRENNDAEGWVRTISVADFDLVWPSNRARLNQLVVRIVNTPSGPEARATFSSSSGGETQGPYVAGRSSPFFRSVEIELDVEDGAQPMEPYDTHMHPVRPADLPRESLTLEAAFAKAGIEIRRSRETNVINTSEAGFDRRWQQNELHDAMEEHWSQFANIPQWKMWIFGAEMGEVDGLAGVMFDAGIFEPGGVERQGTAIFTRAPFSFNVNSPLIQLNPPPEAAVKRELFFTLAHETGHAFNLLHSWDKLIAIPWDAPDWMPNRRDPRSLSWMNYPDQASPGNNSEWFYERFRFRFNDGENLFLRHAPAENVQMGNRRAGDNHARAPHSHLDDHLELSLLTGKQIWEYGEPVVVELRLRNVSNEVVQVDPRLDPAEGFVSVAITEPDGVRKEFVPVIHKHTRAEPQELKPNGEISVGLDLTMGKLGFPFKKSGAYRIEASYLNHDGKMAAAVMQLYVRTPLDTESMAAVHELFNARVGRVFQAGGTRVMEDVTDRMDWVSKRLGDGHPTRLAITALRARPYARKYKRLSGDGKLTVLDADPEFVARELVPVVEAADHAADTLGNQGFASVVDVYTEAAMLLKKGKDALKAQESLLEMFRKRKVGAPILDKITETIKTLK